MQKNATVSAQLKPAPPTKRRKRYRYEFYRDNFRRMTVLVMGLVIVDLVLVVAMFLVYSNFPQAELYATTRNGLLVKLRQFDSLSQVLAAKERKTALKADANVESMHP